MKLYAVAIEGFMLAANEIPANYDCAEFKLDSHSQRQHEGRQGI